MKIFFTKKEVLQQSQKYSVIIEKVFNNQILKNKIIYQHSTLRTINGNKNENFRSTSKKLKILLVRTLTTNKVKTLEK